jgi:hypothetical protein
VSFGGFVRVPPFRWFRAGSGGFVRVPVVSD